MLINKEIDAREACREPVRAHAATAGFRESEAREFRRLLRPEVVTPDVSIGPEGRCIAFRKNADDNCRWDSRDRCRGSRPRLR